MFSNAQLLSPKAPEWKRAYMCVSQQLLFHHRLSHDGVCGWSCDSDYRGLKKRIMASKSTQQCGNDLHSTRTMSSDSEHESLPSRPGPSKWTGGFNHLENADGGRGQAADVQDERQNQQAVMDAPEAQIELDGLKTRGDDLPNVGAVLLSQCVHSNTFFPPRRRPRHPTASPLLSRVQVS